MNRILEALRNIAQHLDEEHRSYAVVGGWAVSARTEPRFTPVSCGTAVRDRALGASGEIWAVLESLTIASDPLRLQKGPEKLGWSLQLPPRAP
jgi:hypothetical protein